MADAAPATAQDTTQAGATQAAATQPGNAQNPTQQPSAAAAGDGKSQDGAAAGNNGGKSEAPGGKPVVPEKYEFKAPEGVTLDSKAVEGFTPIAKELGLTQEQAQKLVDFYGGQLGGLAQAQAAAKQAEVDKWASDAKADPEIGGANFDANVSTAMKAIARFGSPALKEMLVESGLGNHPELVRFCMKVGASISEDTLALGGKVSTGQRDAASVLYNGS